MRKISLCCTCVLLAFFVVATLPYNVSAQVKAKKEKVEKTVTSQPNTGNTSRLALVIGNSSYGFSPLKNSANDASYMASTLQELCFTVILNKNADLRSMEAAVEDFGKRLKRGGTGLFCYAGHGVQIGGINYLIPVSAKINKESDVKYAAFDAEKMLDFICS